MLLPQFTKGNRLYSFYRFMKFKWYNILFFILFFILFNILRCFAILLFFIILLYYSIMSLNNSVTEIIWIYTYSKLNKFPLIHRIIFFEPIQFLSIQFIGDISIKKRFLNIIRWFWYGYWGQIFIFCQDVIWVELCEGDCINTCELKSSSKNKIIAESSCIELLSVYQIWKWIINRYNSSTVGEHDFFLK